MKLSDEVRRAFGGGVWNDNIADRIQSLEQQLEDARKWDDADHAEFSTVAAERAALKQELELANDNYTDCLADNKELKEQLDVQMMLIDDLESAHKTADENRSKAMQQLSSCRDDALNARRNVLIEEYGCETHIYRQVEKEIRNLKEKVSE